MPPEEQPYLIAESIPHLVWVAGPDGATQYINRRWQEYTGLTTGQAMGLDWQSAIHPDDVPRTLDLWRRAVGTGEPYAAEFRLRRADGQYRWHADRALPLRDPQGHITHWFGTCTDIEEQKRAGDAQRASEARFRALIEKSFDAILLLTPQGTVAYASPSTAQLLGFAPEELLGRDAFELVHPEDRARTAALFAELAGSSGSSVSNSHRALCKDGSWRWLDVRATNLLGDPSVRCVVINYQDVTERKQAEATLARDALLLANVQDAVIVTDLDGVTTYWNEGATRLFGWTAEEMMGRPLTDRVPEEARAKMAEATRAIRDGADFSGEWADYRKDGTRVWIDVRVARITDPAGKPVGIMGISRDISDRKRAEAERDRLVARLRLHVERLPLAYLLLDAESRIADWNPAAAQVFGFSREEALGRDPLDLIVPPAARAAVEAVFRRGRDGDMAAHSVNTNRTKDGRVITCEWFNTPLQDEHGRYTGLLGLAQDVTVRKRLEEQFFQAQKMEAVGRLAGGIAHDFNNLLTVINGHAAMLLQDLGEGTPVADSVRAILEAGERAAGLTQQLLAFSRKQIVAARELDLNAVVADTEAMLRRLIGEDVLLTKDLQPGLGAVRADPTQVQQVVMNLAVNARDAMPHGGRLCILTKDVGEHVLLAVTDTGCGMTEEVKAHLFEPFFTTKGPGEGTGLGLSTVYGIVKQGGGHVEVESQPGSGTTVRVYLPRTAGAAAAEKPNGDGTSPRGNETVLLAEDEDGVRALVRQVLQAGGYTVLEAQDGAEALWLAGRHRGPVDLLITDVVMPGLDGRGLAERLGERYPDLRVLYLSGYTDDAVVRHGVLQEKVHFLQKPFSPGALARKVREVLDFRAGDVANPPESA
jgi:PAS domain S-box-containing protein